MDTDEQISEGAAANEMLYADPRLLETLQADSLSEAVVERVRILVPKLKALAQRSYTSCSIGTYSLHDNKSVNKSSNVYIRITYSWSRTKSKANYSILFCAIW
jgi:hypothetical protein